MMRMGHSHPRSFDAALRVQRGSIQMSINAALLSCLLVPLVISACGGRYPLPVATKRSEDEALTCWEIGEQYARNRNEIDWLYQEDILRHQNNAALVVVTVLGGNLANLAGVDRGVAQDVETEALLTRNLNLVALAERKGCEPLYPPMDDVIARVEAEKASRAAAQAAQEEALKQAEEQR